MKHVVESPLRFRQKSRGNTLAVKEHKQIYLARIAGEQVTKEAVEFVARHPTRGLVDGKGEAKSVAGAAAVAWSAR
jgi:hypothetical protein